VAVAVALAVAEAIPSVCSVSVSGSSHARVRSSWSRACVRLDKRKLLNSHTSLVARVMVRRLRRGLWMKSKWLQFCSQLDADADWLSIFMASLVSKGHSLLQNICHHFVGAWFWRCPSPSP